MQDRLKHIDKLNVTLAKLTEEELNQLYLRLFNSPDGELVLQDLSNTCHMSISCDTQIEEGRRQVVLSINTHLYNAVNGKKEVVNE